MVHPRIPPPDGTPRYGRWIASLVAAGVVAMCITLVFLSMRSVMDVGGSCASGNTPFEIATPCPDGTWVMPVAIPLGVVAAGAFAVLAPAGLGGLVMLAWTGLFLSLGWNFLEYGVDPPGPQDGPVWGWVVCGVLFVAMGAGPLLAVVPLARGARDGIRLRRAGGAEAVARRVAAVRAAAPPAPAAAPGAPDGESPRDVVSRLERLAALHRRGDLTGAEYEDAKRLVLDEDAP